MSDFMMGFGISSLWLSGIIVFFLLLKRMFRHILSAQMQYRLWFFLTALLAVPLLPVSLSGQNSPFFWLPALKKLFAEKSISNISPNETGISGTTAVAWTQDLAVSVSRNIPVPLGKILFVLWIIGILVMTLCTIRSFLRLRALRHTALPLQDQKTAGIYEKCLEEMNLQSAPPVYSTAFLRSPALAGVQKPAIYLPIPLILEKKKDGLRFILLHELQHYKQKDGLVNAVLQLFHIIYWFHPLVWLALKEMRNDREVACDAAVLKILDAPARLNYGNVLLDFAENTRESSLSFVSGIGGSKKLLRRRILSIASYTPLTGRKKMQNLLVFLLTGLLLLNCAPILSVYASANSRYDGALLSSCEEMDLSSYFGDTTGCFVLYDQHQNQWSVYNKKMALERSSPNSTYKIFSALFALEEGVITPENSLLSWDGNSYPFSSWNGDQTLASAMAASVNWYFQRLDQRLGKDTIDHYLQAIGYGNENASGDITSYWLESTLKISPVEQTDLLSQLQSNAFGFAPENIAAVKNSLLLSSSSDASLYGKTGTGRINGKDVNGWFTGFVETEDNTYFFTVHLQGEDHATGSAAQNIAVTLLRDFAILS